LLSDSRLANYVSFKNLRNYILTDSALELLNTDYEAFTSRYGEVFVAGFTTGA
jgi:hypothetical protein